jgi:uncharacterized protein
MLGNLLILALVLLGVGAVLTVVSVLLMATVLLRPPRMTDGKALYLLRRLSPSDLGLPFEPVDFHVRDEHTKRPLRIAAWWIPAVRDLGRCVVLVHGHSDAKVGAIAWAPTLRALGFHVLAIDMRAHGESGGVHSTAGCWERHDVNQVIDDLRASRPGQTRQVALFGASLGGAVSMAAAALRDDLLAVVVECPFADYRLAVRTHAGRLGMPTGPLLDVSLRVAQWLSDADFGAVRPVDLVQQLKCPLMIIQSAADPYVEPRDIAAIERAALARAESGLHTVFWKVPDAYHVEALLGDQEAYRERLERFFSSIEAHDACGSRPGVPATPDSRPSS